MTVSNSASGEASLSSSGQQRPLPLPPPSAAAPVKKKRNLPGMPDPNAEVIALSPQTLLATNRFVCEVCNKGFQRDQNLQLHRRGHNLPWKLRQRNGKEAKKRVYVCPEPSCIHHDPSRALGDLTGIKKHFCRKHGEKKWKCDKCSKKYAVQSDWKAHSKTCGTREYRCDCGTPFSRRDSFITHRAFCDALAEESAKAQAVPPPFPPPTVAGDSNDDMQVTAVLDVSSQRPPSAAAVVSASPMSQVASPELQEPETTAGVLEYVPSLPPSLAINSGSASTSSNSTGSTTSATSGSIFASFFPSTVASSGATSQGNSFADLMGAMSRSEPPSLCLSSSGAASFLSEPMPFARSAAPPPSPHLSATALLQKAAEIGAGSGKASLLRGFGLAPCTTSRSSRQEGLHWQNPQPPPPVESESQLLSAGLGLGLPYDSTNGAGLTELIMGPPPFFMPKRSTLDFLGLGVGPARPDTAGLSGIITSIGGGIDMNHELGLHRTSPRR